MAMLPTDENLERIASALETIARTLCEDGYILTTLEMILERLEAITPEDKSPTAPLGTRYLRTLDIGRE